MPKVTFSRSDVRKLLGLRDAAAVEALIKERRLEVIAYTVRGLPLFTADAVLRVAEEMVAPETRSDGERAAR